MTNNCKHGIAADTHCTQCCQEESNEQCRIIGMSSEREARLLAQIEELNKSHAILLQKIESASFQSDRGAETLGTFVECIFCKASKSKTFGDKDWKEEKPHYKDCPLFEAAQFLKLYSRQHHLVLQGLPFVEPSRVIVPDEEQDSFVMEWYWTTEGITHYVALEVDADFAVELRHFADCKLVSRKILKS